jgi:C4-dicarboxylate transporter DctM subunit
MIGDIAIGLLGPLTLSIPVGIVLFLLGFGVDAFFGPFALVKGL